MTDTAESPLTSPLVLARRTALLAPLALSGCGFLDNLFADNKKKLPGLREDVLPSSEGLQAPHGEHPAVSLPAPVSTDWPVEGANPAHDAGNAALPDGIKQAWQASIGRGSAYRHQVTSTPVVLGDSVFTMDSDATVAAFQVSDGHRLWSTHTKPKKSRSTNVGGGIGVADGVVYAATGYGELLAIDAGSGTVNWRKTLPTPGRSAPTIVGGMVFLTTIDQQLLALTTKDGSQVWSFDGNTVATTLLGQPAPAVFDDVVIAGFSSGDLVAMRAASGAVAWTDSIAATSASVGIAQISAISARPVIVGELAFAIGTGGLLVALDLRAGRRLWEREVSGTQSPIAAGDFLFLQTADQQVAALQSRTGEVAWLTQLPQYKRPKSKGAPIIWAGPVLANGKLIFCGTRSDLIMLDALTGDVATTMALPGPVTVPPIVAGGTLYLITDDGQLRAYR